MDDYLCLTIQSAPGEAVDDFRRRLIAFWSHMLRDREAVFERVYAETTRFTVVGDVQTRQYLVEAGVIDEVTNELTAASIEHDPVDPDDVYSKYEATPPDWFQIEH